MSEFSRQLGPSTEKSPRLSSGARGKLVIAMLQKEVLPPCRTRRGCTRSVNPSHQELKARVVVILFGVIGASSLLEIVLRHFVFTP
jgi:hypothetical protein